MPRTDPYVFEGGLSNTREIAASSLTNMPLDIIVPGSPICHSLFDTTVVRNEVNSGVNAASWYILNTLTRDASQVIRLGIVGDNWVGADYDGDSLSAVTIWPPNVDPTLCPFRIRPSLSPVTRWNVAQVEQVVVP